MTYFPSEEILLHTIEILTHIIIIIINEAMRIFHKKYQAWFNALRQK